MPLPPGLAAARRLIAVVCAVLAVAGLGLAFAYASGDTGNGCGNGWEASGQELPSPLFTEAEKAAIARERRNPYEVAEEKTRPIKDCKRAGERRLVTAGLLGALILLPVGAALAFLYWPRREELVEEIVDYPEDDGEPRSFAPSWGDRSGR